MCFQRDEKSFLTSVKSPPPLRTLPPVILRKEVSDQGPWPNLMPFCVEAMERAERAPSEMEFVGKFYKNWTNGLKSQVLSASIKEFWLVFLGRVLFHSWICFVWGGGVPVEPPHRKNDLCSPTYVVLSMNIFTQKRVILHEIGHTIGLFHEQTRPDRDQYVTILWDEVQENEHDQFEIRTEQEVDTRGVSYDYQSIMHYGKSVSPKQHAQSCQVLMPLKSSVHVHTKRDFFILSFFLCRSKALSRT